MTGNDTSELLANRPPTQRLRSYSTLMVDAPQELTAIRDADVNLCVLRRAVSTDLTRFVDEQVAPRDLKRILTCDAAAPDLDALLYDLPQGEGYRSFQDDLRTLVRLYAELTGVHRLRLKLEAFGDNLCERFHVDWVRLRLICSYAGPGTEWLDNHDLNRERLAPRAGNLPDEVSGLILPGARIGQFERFDVGLMKGDLWPEHQGKGLVHRSPRIMGSGARRVLFKIEEDSKGSTSHGTVC